MGLISAIKSLLGFGGGRSGDRSGGTDVTVEREPDASSERAVKESDATATGDADTDDGAGGDAGGRAELTFENEPDATGEDDTDGSAEDATSGDERTDGESADEIKGIGPAYAERLADAGIHTVSDLADADAAALDGETGIGENRLQGWIDRANAR
jgi:predicted flap endonuclease-1-like 5' DNA nuclease